MLIKIAIAAAAVWAYSLWTMFGAYRDAPLLPDDSDQAASHPQAREPDSHSARMRMAEGRWGRPDDRAPGARLLGRHI